MVFTSHFWFYKVYMNVDLDCNQLQKACFFTLIRSLQTLMYLLIYSFKYEIFLEIKRHFL